VGWQGRGLKTDRGALETPVKPAKGIRPFSDKTGLHEPTTETDSHSESSGLSFFVIPAQAGT